MTTSVTVIAGSEEAEIIRLYRTARPTIQAAMLQLLEDGANGVPSPEAAYRYLRSTGLTEAEAQAMINALGIRADAG